MVSEFKFSNSSPVGIADVDLNRHPDSSIGSDEQMILGLMESKRAEALRTNMRHLIHS